MGAFASEIMDFLERFEHQGKGVGLRCVSFSENGLESEGRQVVWEGSNKLTSRLWLIALIQVRRKS